MTFQDLSIVLTSEHPVEELEIIEDDEHLSSIIVSCFVDEQVFRNFNCMLSFF